MWIKMSGEWVLWSAGRFLADAPAKERYAELLAKEAMREETEFWEWMCAVAPPQALPWMDGKYTKAQRAQLRKQHTDALRHALKKQQAVVSKEERERRAMQMAARRMPPLAMGPPDGSANHWDRLLPELQELILETAKTSARRTRAHLNIRWYLFMKLTGLVRLLRRLCRQERWTTWCGFSSTHITTNLIQRWWSHNVMFGQNPRAQQQYWHARALAFVKSCKKQRWIFQLKLFLLHFWKVQCGERWGWVVLHRRRVEQRDREMEARFRAERVEKVRAEVARPRRPPEYAVRLPASSPQSPQSYPPPWFYADVEDARREGITDPELIGQCVVELEEERAWQQMEACNESSAGWEEPEEVEAALDAQHERDLDAYWAAERRAERAERRKADRAFGRDWPGA